MQSFKYNGYIVQPRVEVTSNNRYRAVAHVMRDTGPSMTMRDWNLDVDFDSEQEAFEAAAKVGRQVIDEGRAD